MLHMSRRTLGALAIFAVLLGSGCDQALTSPDVLAPSRDLTAVLTATGTVAPVNKLNTYVTPAGDAYYTQVIGPRGGRLVVSKSSVTVPKNAVDEDVVFTAHVLPGDTVHFALTATRVSNGMPYGLFNVPVTLKISYEDVNYSSETALVVAYLPDGTTNGTRIGLSTRLSKANKAVYADLIHFSDYALGEN